MARPVDRPLSVTRVNQEIPDELHTRAKLLSVRRGQSLKAWVEEAIREAVERQEAEQAEAERRRRR